MFEAGDAFFIGPGHTPIIFAGCEVVYFTRTEEANRELPLIMANLMKYLEEQGIEVPAAPQPSPQSAPSAACPPEIKDPVACAS